MKPWHGRLEFVMPAPSTEAFEAFFNHEVRLRWDTLLHVTYVEGGGTHPYAGAISTNRGRGWKAGMAMRTRFLVYDPPRLASAEMVEPTGVFELWAASMRFRDRGRELRPDLHLRYPAAAKMGRCAIWLGRKDVVCLGDTATVRGDGELSSPA